MGQADGRVEVDLQQLVDGRALLLCGRAIPPRGRVVHQNIQVGKRAPVKKPGHRGRGVGSGQIDGAVIRLVDATSQRRRQGTAPHTEHTRAASGVVEGQRVANAAGDAGDQDRLHLNLPPGGAAPRAGAGRR